MKRRIVSIVLALALCLTLLPAAALAGGTITGVEAMTGLTYNGQAQKGYTGTPAMDGYGGAFTVSYAGRNETTYSSSEPPTNAGDYTVIIAVPAEEDYSGSISLDFTIDKATVMIAPASVSSLEDLNLESPVLGVDYTATGLLGMDTMLIAPTLTCELSLSTADIKIYTVTASGGDAGENYTLTYGSNDIYVFPTASDVASVTVNGTTTSYTDIDAAWAAAKAADSAATVTLLANVESGTALTVEIGDDITLDGGKFTLTSTASKVVDVSGGSFTLAGGTLDIHDQMTETKRYGLYVSGGIAAMRKGTIQVTDTTTGSGGQQCYGISVMEKGTVIIHDGTITASAGAELNDTGVGVQVTDNGTAVINGGTISGTGALNGYGVRAFNGSTTSVTITGGEFTGSNGTGIPGFGNSAGLYIGSNNGVNVALSGGRFTGGQAAVRVFGKAVSTLLKEGYVYYQVTEQGGAEVYEYAGADAEVVSKGNHDLQGAAYIVDECTHEVTAWTNNSDENHSGTCSRCGTTVKEAHTYTNGSCICGAKKPVDATPPTAPTYEQLKDTSSAGSPIAPIIRCVTEGSSHSAVEYLLAEDSYTLGEVTWDDEQEKWYCDVTVNAVAYIASYSKVYGVHELAAGEQDSQVVRFYYTEGETNPWNVLGGYGNQESRKPVFQVVHKDFAVTVTTDGNGTASASPASAPEGTEITLTAAPNSGYRFKEWQVVSGTVTISGDKFIMPAENVTVKAVFEARPAAPTYDQLTDNSSNGSPIAVIIRCTTDQDPRKPHYETEYQMLENKSGVTSYSLDEVTWDEAEQKWYCDVTVYAAPHIAAYIEYSSRSGGWLHVLADGQPESRTVRFWYTAGDVNPWRTADGYRGTQRKLTFEVVDQINPRTITLEATSITPVSVELQATVSKKANENEIIYYAMNTTGAEPAAGDWHSFSIFDQEYDGIQPGMTYYFFAKVNAYPATGHTAACSEALQVTTPAKAVSGIEIATQPGKLAYTSGEALDLTGLTVKVTYNDGTDEIIADLTQLTTAPANGAALTVAANNGKPVTVSCGGQSCTTDALTVSQAAQSLAISGVPGSVRQGDSFPLTATGGSGSGAITWSVVSGPATVDQNGNVTVTGTGEITIKTVKAADGEYLAAEKTLTFTARSRTSSGSSGGSSGGAARYTVSVDAGDNGAVSASHKSASSGTTVTITVAADAGYDIGAVTVTGKNGRAIPVKDRGDGRYTFTMPSSQVTVEATFVRAASGGYADCPNDRTCPIWPFTDADPGAWYHDGVHYCLDNGLMNGYADGTLRPTAALSRAQLCQILYNLEGRPAVSGGSVFSDVPTDLWCADAVRWAADNGIVTGYADGAFRPNAAISREQLAVLLYRCAVYQGMESVTLEENLTGFADADAVGGYAVQAMNWAVGQGILGGYADGTLKPKDGATRAAAQMLKNFMERAGA